MSRNLKRNTLKIRIIRTPVSLRSKKHLIGVGKLEIVPVISVEHWVSRHEISIWLLKKRRYAEVFLAQPVIEATMTLMDRRSVFLWRAPDGIVYNRCGLHGLTVLPPGSSRLFVTSEVRCYSCLYEIPTIT